MRTFVPLVLIVAALSIAAGCVPAKKGPPSVTAPKGPATVSAQDGPATVPAQKGPATASAQDGPATVPAQKGPATASAQDGPATVPAQKGPASAPVAAGPPDKAASEAFRIAGSGSNIPLTQRLLDAYGRKTGVFVRIPPSIGSAGAIKALQAAKLDIGLLSRPINEAEIASGLTQKPYARIAIVFGAHPGVPDSDLKPEDLIRVYSGAKSKWSDGKMIIVLVREAGDSSNAVLERVVPGFKQVLEESMKTKRWEAYYTDAEMNEAIEATPGSLGFTDSAYLVEHAREIKALRLAGVEPTAAAVAAGRYPLYKDLAFAFAEPLSREAASFMDFVFSEEGKKAQGELGCVPLNGD